MPVLDGDFEAFVTNLGKYNEGMLVGEWVKLPTTEEEMQKVFERIGIGKQDEFGQPYEEWFITDYECPIYGVQKMLGEYENLDIRDEGDRMEIPTKRVKEGVSCRALLSLESLLKKLKSNPFKARLVRLPVIDRRVFRSALMNPISVVLL